MRLGENLLIAVLASVPSGAAPAAWAWKPGVPASSTRGGTLRKHSLSPIGVIRSELKNREDAPRFYTEGAPNAVLELLPAYRRGLSGVHPGDQLIVITWLHRAHRNVLRVHPQGNRSRPLTGVFLTRSPDRPNPLGLHRVTVLEVRPNGLFIGPIEAIDGTPVVDIKTVVREADDR